MCEARKSNRWTARRKAELVSDIRTGAIMRDAAKRMHGLSEEELSGWETRFSKHGQKGLRVTKVQGYRRLETG